MPRPDGFRRAMEGYLSTLAADGYAEKTLRGYRYALHKAHQTLRTVGLPPSPSRFTDEHRRLLWGFYKDDPWLLSTMAVCLRAIGVKVELPRVIRPPRHVRWLTKEQAEHILRVSTRLGPPYSTLVHLELQNGFRRVSVMRARVRDMETTPIYVRGKGKDYTIVPHPDLPDILETTMDWRGTHHYISEYLLPARSYGKEHMRSEQGMDLIIQRVAKEAGVVASNHDLRRTFGRNLWEAGVKIEVISEQMGHTSIDMTRQYLGISHLDQEAAMKMLAIWESRE